MRLSRRHDAPKLKSIRFPKATLSTIWLMTPATYEAIFGRECGEYTAVLVNAEDDPFEAAARLQSEFDVKAVTVTE